VRRLLASLPEDAPSFEDLVSRDNKIQSEIYAYQDKVAKKDVKAISIPTAIRVDSASEEGSCLIIAVPNSSSATIDTDVFSNLLRLRLGIPLLMPEGVECECGKELDAYGRHVLSQCGHGGLRQARHDAVAFELAAIAKDAGLSVSWNSAESLLAADPSLLKLKKLGSKGRTDLTFQNWSACQSMDIDVKITDPRALETRKKPPDPGTQAAFGEKEKIDKYAEAVGDSCGGLFSPFVMETFGRWGERSRSVFSTLVERLVIITGWKKSSATSYWRTRVSLAMHVTGMRLAMNKVAAMERSKEIHQLELELEDPFLDIF